MSSGDPRDTNASSVWIAVEKAELPNKKYFKIGEVASLVGVEPHVLRYWQTQFPRVRPQKSRSGHRLYRRKDVELLLAIKELLHVQRFTIAGARQALKTIIAGADERSTPPKAAEAKATTAPKTSQLASYGKGAADSDSDLGPQAKVEIVGLEKQDLNAVMDAEMARGTPGGVVSVDVVEGSEPLASTPPEGAVQVEIGVEEDYSWTQVDLTSTPPKSVANTQPTDTDEDSVNLSAIPSAASEASSQAVVSNDGPATMPVENGRSEASAKQLELSTNATPEPTTQKEPLVHHAPSRRQLGFGFAPTNKDLLLKAKRDLLSLIDFLDREDQKSRRRPSS